MRSPGRWGRERGALREPDRAPGTGRPFRLGIGSARERAARVAASLLTAALAVGSLAGCEGGEVDEPELLTAEMPIEYPLDLWDRGVEGRTLLRVRVDASGRVDSVEVTESSGYAAFDSAATRGARDLEFRPARRDGEPTTVWAEVPVHFSRDTAPEPRAPDTANTDEEGA